MHRQFDRNLYAVMDQKATPPLSRRLALVLACGLVALLAWYGSEQKTAQDAQDVLRKAAKKKAVAESEK